MRYIKASPAKPKQRNQDLRQGELDLKIERQKDIDGIGMGILSDGTPFLNQRGLARLCGVQNAHIGTISSEWHNDVKPRIVAIKNILRDRGLQMTMPHIPVGRGAQTIFAYPEQVCMAILEYYAFDAGANNQPEAKRRIRWLAGRSLREMIYDQLGYKRSETSLAWQQFRDRVSLVHDSVPDGFFCVFKEIAFLMVELLDAGVNVGPSFVPDISVGSSWSKYWVDNNVGAKLGQRTSYSHRFPDYFPQAASNPQSAHCYPDAALGAFRKWMREVYLPNVLPNYLNNKVKEGQVAAGSVQLAIAGFTSRGARKPISYS